MPKVTISKSSSDQAIHSWISSCIRYVRRKEGKSASQAAGQCYGMARSATGKSLGEHK